MPEGDTVWRAAHSLDRALAGQRLLVTDFRTPQLATSDLSGGLVLETVGRGKHLLTRIIHDTGQWTIHSHLKMEGAWRVFRPGERWRRPEHEARVVLSTADRVAVGFSLGILQVLPTAAENDVVGHLGPDLLGSDWDEDEAVRRLGADRSGSIDATDRRVNGVEPLSSRRCWGRPDASGRRTGVRDASHRRTTPRGEIG